MAFAEPRIIFSGSANTLANLPGLVRNSASAIAKGYCSEYFHAFSTGAPSPNFQSEFVNVVSDPYTTLRVFVNLYVSEPALECVPALIILFVKSVGVSRYLGPVV